MEFFLLFFAVLLNFSLILQSEKVDIGISMSYKKNKNYA